MGWRRRGEQGGGAGVRGGGARRCGGYGRDRSFKLGGEFLYGDRSADSHDEEGEEEHEDPSSFFSGGYYAYAQFQFSRRGWIQARYGRVDPSDADQDSERVSALLGFVPSEFQALRLEYSWVSTPEDDYSEIFLQYNFTIGSHPAHAY